MLESRRTPSLLQRWLTRLMIFSFLLYWSLLLVFWISNHSYASEPQLINRHGMDKEVSHHEVEEGLIQLVRAGGDIKTSDQTTELPTQLISRTLPAVESTDTASSSLTVHGDDKRGQMIRHIRDKHVTSGLLQNNEVQKLPSNAISHDKDVKLLPSGETERRTLKCIGWRNTEDCRPDGPREPEKDLPCSDIVPNSASGYCEVEDTHSGERFRVMSRSCNILRRDVPFRCANAPAFASFRVQAHDAIQKVVALNYTLPHVSTQSPKPRHGIVMVVYPKLIPSAYATIRALRDIFGCFLPIEVWYRPDEMENAPMALSPLERLAQNHSVGTISFHEIIDPDAKRFVAKVYAIYNSFFDCVLFLDADNVPVRDPSFLFGTPEFLQTGAIFWPDFWHPTSTMFGIHSKSLLWELLDIPFVDMFEQESGQLLVDRRRHSAPLELVLFYAVHDPNFFVHYKLAWGDKDFFRLAWLKLGAPFHMIETPPAMAGIMTSTSAFCGMTMVQHDAQGEVLFLHRNKHKLTGMSRFNPAVGVEAPGSRPSVLQRNTHGSEDDKEFADPAIWVHLMSFDSNYSREDYVVERFITSLDFSSKQKCFGRRHLDKSPQFHVQKVADLSYAGFETNLRHFAMDAAEATEEL